MKKNVDWYSFWESRKAVQEYQAYCGGELTFEWDQFRELCEHLPTLDNNELEQLEHSLHRWSVRKRELELLHMKRVEKRNIRLLISGLTAGAILGYLIAVW